MIKLIFNGINLLNQQYSSPLENVEDPPAGGGARGLFINKLGKFYNPQNKWVISLCSLEYIVNIENM